MLPCRDRDWHQTYSEWDEYSNADAGHCQLPWGMWSIVRRSGTDVARGDFIVNSTYSYIMEAQTITAGTPSYCSCVIQTEHMTMLREFIYLVPLWQQSSTGNPYDHFFMHKISEDWVYPDKRK